VLAAFFRPSKETGGSWRTAFEVVHGLVGYLLALSAHANVVVGLDIYGAEDASVGVMALVVIFWIVYVVFRLYLLYVQLFVKKEPLFGGSGGSSEKQRLGVPDDAEVEIAMRES